MGFFNFVKNIGRKIGGAAKIVYGQGKNMLKTGVSIGSKIVNNPILNKAVNLATPFLSATPYGRAALLGFKGIQKGFQFGNSLVQGINSAEKAVKSIEKLKRGDYLSGTGDLISSIKGGFDAQSGIKSGSEGMKSSVIGIREQFS
jgi:hypothetical protein